MRNRQRKAGRREEEVLRRRQISLGQRHHQRQHLRFAELARRQLEFHFSLVVGRGGVRPIAGQLIANFAADQRRAVIELGADLAFDLLAAIKHFAIGVDRQLHRFQLIFVDRERAGEAVVVVVVHDDAVTAQARLVGGSKKLVWKLPNSESFTSFCQTARLRPSNTSTVYFLSFSIV